MLEMMKQYEIKSIEKIVGGGGTGGMAEPPPAP